MDFNDSVAIVRYKNKDIHINCEGEFYIDYEYNSNKLENASYASSSLEDVQNHIDRIIKNSKVKIGNTYYYFSPHEPVFFGQLAKVISIENNNIKVEIKNKTIFIREEEVLFDVQKIEKIDEFKEAIELNKRYHENQLIERQQLEKWQEIRTEMINFIKKIK
jgi:MFS superfamily sulfate permease-like transporter